MQAPPPPGLFFHARDQKPLSGEDDLEMLWTPGLVTAEGDSEVGA